MIKAMKEKNVRRCEMCRRARRDSDEREEHRMLCRECSTLYRPLILAGLK